MSARTEFARRWFRALAASLSALACSDAGSPATRFGAIYLNSHSASEPTQAADALFYRFSSPRTASRCGVADELGACRIWQCVDYESVTSRSEISLLSAGSLSVSGGNTALVFDETAPGSYSWEDTLQVPLWEGGQRLTATVGGSTDFPSATLSAIAPDRIAVTAPVVPAEAWRLDPGKDLGLAWTGAIRSDVYIAVSIVVAAADGGPDVLFPAVDCAFLGEAGVGHVPASLLQLVPKPAGSVGHDLAVLTFSGTSIRVEDAIIDLRATSLAFSSPVTIE